MKRIALPVTSMVLLAALAAAGDFPHTVSLKGAVVRSGPLERGRTDGLLTWRRLVKVALPDGRYRATLDVEGYALKDILDRVEVRKVDDGFKRPLDTFVVVTGAKGSQALFSYGELTLGSSESALLVDKARLVLPHHHEPVPLDTNNPTLPRNIAERDRLDLKKCASCHEGPEPPPLSLPKGWLLVTAGDTFGGRFVEDVSEIDVRQMGIPVKDNRSAARKAVVNTPVIVSAGGNRTALTPERFREAPQRTWTDATFGMGRGFHGTHRWQGVELAALLRPLLPSGVDPRAVWVLVTAGDGYRSLFSGSEVFAAPDGRRILLVDRRNGQTLGEGSGRYHVLAPGDFYIDREVKMVKELRVGVLPKSN